MVEKGSLGGNFWGLGFNDGRRYTLADCEKLVRFLKDDPKYGGTTVMLGVPTNWRTLDGDCLKDEKLHDIIRAADIVSPWTIGRYVSPKMAAEHSERRAKPDMAWCRENGKEYLPVVFPGFSWHNLKRDAPLDQIPRLKGEFLWRQYTEAKKLGATMVYQAMFDEVDEGTAIFKCTNDPPVGESKFLTYEGLPTDHYLWLTGMGCKLVRGDIAATDALPARAEKPEGKSSEKPAGPRKLTSSGRVITLLVVTHARPVGHAATHCSATGDNRDTGQSKKSAEQFPQSQRGHESAFQEVAKGEIFGERKKTA